MMMPSFRSGETSTSAVKAVHDLLCDHLNGALDHCDAIDMASLQLGASVVSGDNGRAILRQNRNLSDFVGDLYARELAIALRLTQAGVVAERAAGLSRASGSIAALIRSGAGVLVDAGTRIASEARDIGPFAYLVSRGLLEGQTTSLPDHIESGDHFVVLGVMSLADVRAFLDAALRAIDSISIDAMPPSNT